MKRSWPENSPANPIKAIEELIQGRQFANQLRGLLSKSVGDDGSAPEKDLVLKILNSFTNTLSLLNSAESDVDVDIDVTQVQPNTQATSPCWDAPKSESSEESCRSNSTVKDRRGCYKRRKTSLTVTKETPTLIDDGHAWRKYGQKPILNAKYPRHYYRCTHKYDQGCQAAKQVQRIQEDPVMHRTIYIGNHTCRTFQRVPELILDSSPNDSPFVLSFDNTFTNKHDHPFLSSSFQSVVKQEHKEEMPAAADYITHNNQSSSSDYLVSPDQTALESFYNSMPVLSSSPMASDNGKDISEILVGSADFADDDLLFEF